tara:strand:+ start:1899 stop:2366 length:468 start_codon:yes stop_codon:yes gene_type:complete
MEAKRKGPMKMRVITLTMIVLVVAVTGLFFTAMNSENMTLRNSMKGLPLIQWAFQDVRLPPDSLTPPAVDHPGREAIKGNASGRGEDEFEASRRTEPIQSASRDHLTVEHRLLRDALDDLEGQMASRRQRGHSIDVAADAAGDVSLQIFEEGDSQ